jgi:hypothetical protein
VNATHAYVAYRKCGHPVALLVDDEDKVAVGKEVGALIAAGYTIDRVTIARAREIGVVYCGCE